MMLIHERPPEPGERAPIEPNWRVWRLVAAAIVLFVAASDTAGVASFVLLVAALAAGCRALVVAIPYPDGLTEHRQ